MLAKRSRLRNRLTGARLGLVGGRGFPYSATGQLTNYAPSYVGLTNEWQAAEALATDNFVDTLAGATLTQTGSPALAGVTGKTARTFTVAGSKQGIAVATSGLACVLTNFSGSAVWRQDSPGGTNQTIFGCRTNGSADANVTFLLRLASTMDLNFCIGTGDGASIDIFTVRAGFTDSASFHWFAWSCVLAAKSIRCSLDGGPIQTFTATNMPTVLPTTPRIGIGGIGGEYGNMTVARARLWQTTAVTDDVLRVQDFNDPRGV